MFHFLWTSGATCKIRILCCTSNMSTPHVFLQFDKQAFFPGQEVTGVVVLVVTQPVKALNLQIQWCVVDSLFRIPISPVLEL